LLNSGDYPLPSINQIIKQAGIAKGTVYLYFSSREEIYLSLLMNYFNEFENNVLQGLENIGEQSVNQILVDAYLKFAQQSPKGVYLACIAPLILENNLSAQFIYQFKAHIRDLTSRIFHKIVELNQDTEFETLRIKFLLGYNLFLASWQHCHPVSSVLDVLKNEELENILYNFEKEFPRGFHAIWENI
jgi:AcrR family transcriptional regulator